MEINKNKIQQFRQLMILIFQANIDKSIKLDFTKVEQKLYTGNWIIVKKENENMNEIGIKIDTVLIRTIYHKGNTLMMFDVLENNLLEFLKYINLEYYEEPEKRENIYSPFLANLLQNIVSQTDSFFRYWDIVHDIWNNDHGKTITNEDIKKLNFGDYKKVEDRFSLSDKKLTLLPIGVDIRPFESRIKDNEIIKWNEWKQDRNNDWKKDSKCWWNAYNHVKHNGFYAKEDGNLENVVQSLGALFILNCLHKDVSSWLKKYRHGSSIINKSVINGTKTILCLDVDANSKLFHFEGKNIRYPDLIV